MLILIALGSDCGFCEHCDKPNCSLQVTAKYTLYNRNRLHTVRLVVFHIGTFHPVVTCFLYR